MRSLDTDYYLLEETLSDQEREIRDKVHAFAGRGDLVLSEALEEGQEGLVHQEHLVPGVGCDVGQVVLVQPRVYVCSTPPEEGTPK